MVELIAALALVSIVAVLIITTMGIGFKHSIMATNKTVTQQEANLIVSKLMAQHRKGDCYNLKGEAGSIKIAPNPSCDPTTEPNAIAFNRISDARYVVDLLSVNKMVNPKKEDYTLKAQVTVNKAKYQIETKLTRYKTNN